MYQYPNNMLRLSMRSGLSSIRLVRNIGRKPPGFPEDDEKPPTEFEKRLAAGKEKLNWRDSTMGNPNYWESKFGLFAPERENMAFVTAINQPIDLSYRGYKARKERNRIKTERLMQQFIPDRHRILGNDLAAAHFIVHRNGQVKFVNKPEWVKKDEDTEYSLPSKYHPDYKIEAIVCDGMELYYEGLENIRRLNDLKYISFRDIKIFDDWCLDRVSGSQFENLEVLDLSGTSITERGLCALYRLPTLKTLYVTNPAESISFELSCEMLYDIIPNLKICSSNVGIVKW